MYAPFRMLDSAFEGALRSMIADEQERLEEEGPDGLNGRSIT